MEAVSQGLLESNKVGRVGWRTRVRALENGELQECDSKTALTHILHLHSRGWRPKSLLL